MADEVPVSELSSYLKNKLKGDSPTRGPTDAEIISMFKAGKIGKEEFEGLLEYNRKIKFLQKQGTKRPPPRLPTRKPKPPPRKMMGGGMASKRNGNMDYRKGGMVYSTKVKKG